MRIGDYECLTPLMTAGSGSARWCVAGREGRTFFLKQFLSPALPAESLRGTPLWELQRKRCAAFEARKRRLYEALSCVLGDCVVPVEDFFACNGRYCAVSEYIDEPRETLETARGLTSAEKRDVLYRLICCLQRLHAQGVVHADLKPEHVLLTRAEGGFRVRLIDFDSGFLEDEPIDRELEGDPVYLAPEVFLRMSGDDAPMDHRIDTFAFGAMAHVLWTGELPGIDRSCYTYLYESALAGGGLSIADELPLAYRGLVLRALQRDPDARPDDAELARLLAPPASERRRARQENGMSRYLRGTIGD